MIHSRLLPPTLAAALSLLATAVALAAEPVPPDHAAKMAASQTLFKEKVRGFLNTNCLQCHGGEKTKSGFNLATRESLLKGGDRGAAVVPGKGSQSLLVKLVARTDEPHMPPKQPASKESIELLTKWIDLGAAYDKPLTDAAEPTVKKPLAVTEKDKQYWAYRPLQPIAAPAVKNAAWVRNPIDSFVLARLEAKGIAPASDADRRTLIRRVTFDLTGLPPSPEDVETFVADTSPTAYEKVVDRLLASPQFGERWARHWLDPARYAESHGFEHDYYRPNAYHYRDFVIKALNADMPYKRFAQWQIAGDELAPNDPLALAATGFLGAGVYPTQITNREAERVRYDAMDDMLATTGHAMLALTVGCARCHDHKYDPIPTRDYYRMLSAFTTTVRSEVEWDFGTPEEKKATADFEAKLKPHADALKKLDAKDKTKATERKELEAKIAELEKSRPKTTKVLIQATTEGRKPMRHHTATGDIPDFYPETFVLKRGDAGQKEGVADQGFLQVLSRAGDGEKHWIAAKPATAPTTFRRVGLANWITDTDTGAGSLAARVIVNRLWHHHFGRGIVTTLNDFGFQGDPPTHPELLEWLANDLVANGWTLKRVHKLMVTSRAYQLAGTPSEAGAKLDVDNRLWHHRPKRRLEAEAIRDSLLAVGGHLDGTMYGPGLPDEGMKRRSIYFRVQRSALVPMLQVFDWPDTLTSASARSTTIVAPQALLFLNNPQVRSCADGLAKRVQPLAAKSPSDAVTAAYQIVFSRPPTDEERAAGVEYLKQRPLADYALVLLSLNAFIYVD